MNGDNDVRESSHFERRSTCGPPRNGVGKYWAGAVQCRWLLDGRRHRSLRRPAPHNTDDFADDGGVQHGGRLAVVAFNKDRIPTWFFNSSEADMAFTFVRVGDEVTRGKVAGELPDQHEAAFGDLRACSIGHRPEWSDDEGAE